MDDMLQAAAAAAAIYKAQKAQNHIQIWTINYMLLLLPSFRRQRREGQSN
jgi:hypothetical protein